MPKKNLKGGSKFKKSAKTSHQDDEEGNAIFIEKGEGEQYGRINRIIGNNNAIVFCNDGYERLCHIRGRLRKKKIWLQTGDIVLISTRDFESIVSRPDLKDKRGDILTKYDVRTYSKLRKDETINPLIFVSPEIQNSGLVGNESREVGYSIDDCDEVDEAVSENDETNVQTNSDIDDI